jgi:hypothetical protein
VVVEEAVACFGADCAYPSKHVLTDLNLPLFGDLFFGLSIVDLIGGRAL